MSVHLFGRRVQVLLCRSWRWDTYWYIPNCHVFRVWNIGPVEVRVFVPDKNLSRRIW